MRAKPTIANVAMTLADTEYSYTLPAGTKSFRFKLRDPGADCKIAFVAAGSPTTYMNLPGGRSYAEDAIKPGGAAIYFQSPTASMVAEIMTWK